MKLQLLLFRKIADSNVQVNSETFIHLFAARRLATAASAEESKIGRRVQKSKKIKRPLRIDVKRHVSVAHAISKFYRIDCLARASQAKTTSCFRLYSMTPSTHSMTMSTALLCRLSWPTQMTVGTLEWHLCLDTLQSLRPFLELKRLIQMLKPNQIRIFFRNDMTS